MKEKKRRISRREKICEVVFFLGIFMAIGFIGGMETAPYGTSLLKGTVLTIACLSASGAALYIGRLYE